MRFRVRKKQTNARQKNTRPNVWARFEFGFALGLISVRASGSGSGWGKGFGFG